MKPLNRILFLLIAGGCLTPYLSAPMALILGMSFALLLGHPDFERIKNLTPILLQFSIIGLGAGMNLSVIGEVGIQGLGYTALGILITLGIGILLGRALRVDPNTSLLLSVGTAICGGSAIAAVSPVIRARTEEISISLASVFFLNSLALFLFPPIGHYFHLTAHQFGVWSAISIHDTSSVVGAALSYGASAVEIATPIKLARALWILPISLAIGWLRWDETGRSSQHKIKRPWFILGFILASACVTWIPSLASLGKQIHTFSKQVLVLILFLVGSQFNHASLKSVGASALLQAFVLWVITASLSLTAILHGIVR